MKYITFLSMLLLSTSLSFACPVTDKVGSPKLTVTTIELCHDGYLSQYDPTTKTPRVSSEHLLGSVLGGGAEDRNCVFKPDPLLKKEQSALASDYHKSGYAEGHMAPYYDFHNIQSQASDSCLFSNAVPQIQVCNNSGVWSSTEKYVDSIAVRDGELFIATGPIFGNKVNNIGNGVRIPDAMFKVVYNPKLNQTLSFIVTNIQHCGEKPEKFIVDQLVVEKAAGVKLFPNISGYTIGKKLW